MKGKKGSWLVKHVHAFTRAVSVGNPREFLQAEKEDQEMAKRANGSSRIR